MMNVIRDSKNNIILVFEGAFEEMIRHMEATFGPNTYYDVCYSHGVLKFNDKTFVWDGIEKNIIHVPICGV